MSATTRVVNLRAEPFDVYIGRAGKGQDGYFGNPHKRDEGLGSFRTYFLTRLARDAEFKRRVEELRGKTLGCFCKPGPCHGDVIVEWLDAMNTLSSPSAGPARSGGSGQAPPTLPDEDLEERAAILEFDAGLPRAEAERRARELVRGE